MRLFIRISLTLTLSSHLINSYVIVPHVTKSKYTSKAATVSSLSASKCGSYDFDVAIIGCGVGVGGHGAALHSRAQELHTAVFAGGDVGGPEYRQVENVVG
jgi:hypothetical protein